MHTLDLVSDTSLTYIPQSSVVFYISLWNGPDGSPMTMMASGEEITFTARIYGDDFKAALAEIDNRLDHYQEANPGCKMTEICNNEVMEVMNLLLEMARLKPVNEDKFNFADVLFWIDNPALARQMNHGL